MKEKYTVKFYWSNGMVDREEYISADHWLDAVRKARLIAIKRSRLLTNGVELGCRLYNYKGPGAFYDVKEAIWGEHWMRPVSKEEANFFGK